MTKFSSTREAGCNPLGASKKGSLEYQKFPLSIYEVREESFKETLVAILFTEQKVNPSRCQ